MGINEAVSINIADLEMNFFMCINKVNYTTINKNFDGLITDNPKIYIYPLLLYITKVNELILSAFYY